MKGDRRHGLGFQTEVRVKGAGRSVKQWPADSDPAERRKWRLDEKARLRLQAPRAGKGSFEAEARRYLALVESMPSYQMRERDIGLWIGVFGQRPLSSITEQEIRAQRDRWRRVGPKRTWRKHQDRHGGAWEDVPGPLAASTVNHRLRALANLYTVLHGRHAPNPAREVPELVEDQAEDRSLPYDVIETIFAAMSERRYGRKLTATQAAEIRQRCAGEHNKSAIAREYGVSETMVRKIARAKVLERDDAASKTLARIRMIPYTGISHAELKRLKPHMVSVRERWIDTGRRRKGAGVVTGRRPLTEAGVKALEGFIAADAWGKFSSDSMRAAFRRAVEKVIAALEQTPDGQAIADTLRRLKSRPYDLRHSFVGEVLEKGGDLHATQLLAGHADLRTTMRYAQRAVNPALRAALEKVTAAGGFSAPPKRATAVSD